VDLTAAPTLGLDRSRQVDPSAYAIGGQAPRVAVRPADRDEVAEMLRAAHRDRLSVVPWGGGVALPFVAAPWRYSVALDLRALDRLIEYDPEDFTLTAECGVPLATLAAAVAARGQELPLESAQPHRSTLGGVLAMNASGPRRRRFGAPRDRILGARFALGEGALARTGGRVVKNVAGFAVHRLLCGSRGGLAVLLEASLKLAPAPARRIALVYALEPHLLADADRWAALPRLEPAWLTVLGRAHRARVPDAPDTPCFAVVGLEDDAAWVERQRAVVEQTLGTPASAIEGADVAALRQRVTDAEVPATVRLAFASAHVSPPVLARVLELPGAGTLVFHAPAGRLRLAVGEAEAAAVVARLAPLGFSLVDVAAPGPVAPAVPATAAVRALRARVRAALDPHEVMAFGSRWERGLESV
jgi:FAD/FMN-containing dehydrogenase